MILGQLRRRCVTSDLPHLVANPIDDRLPEISLHRADMSRLEEVEPFDQIEGGILHQIVGVEAATRDSWQAAVGPALKLRQAPLEERFGGHPVTFPCPDHQLHRRLIAQQRVLNVFRA
jgi:hypothetical protein